MKIVNAKIFTKNFTFEEGSLQTKADKIVSVNNEDQEVIDAQGLNVIPGLIDIHFHGSVRHDFMEGTVEALDAISRYQASQGITAICPATMTMSKEDILKACENAKNYQVKEDGADLVGINMEGPFVSERKVGAQNPAYVIKPDVNFFREAQKASGNLIKLMAIAPETEGALEAIAELKGEVLPSIAHTVANYDIAKKAIDLGAKHITHLYNAMPGLAHREPGPIAAGSDSPECDAEIILDGVHIHPAAARCAFRLFGKERMILISDSMMAVGLPDGEYELGGQKVYVKGRLATLASGTIAGSATNLYECMKTAYQKMDLPIETVVRCATYNPAKSIKVLDRYGTLEEGKIASFLFVDNDLNLKGIVLRGKFLKKDF